MKFKFSLEKVLQHRKVIENLAQRDFQEAMSAFLQEEQKLTDMLSSITSAREQSFGYQSRGENIAESLKQIDDFIKGQDFRVELQKKKIQEHKRIVEEKREILRQKAIEYKIVEELKNKKKQQFKLAAGKLEQKQNDDMVVMRYAREMGQDEE